MSKNDKKILIWLSVISVTLSIGILSINVSGFEITNNQEDSALNSYDEQSSTTSCTSEYVITKETLVDENTTECITMSDTVDETSSESVSEVIENKIDRESIWTEVPIIDESYAISATYENFDLEQFTDRTDFVFRGRVIDRKEYSVQWIDENEEIWGPYPSSVIDVQIIEEYYGNNPVAGETIQIYCPLPLSAVISDSFQIKKDHEYIFMTEYLDDDFIKERNLNCPDDKFEQEKHADVYVPNLKDNVISILNNNAVISTDFLQSNIFNSIIDVEKSKEINSNTALTNDSCKSGNFEVSSEKDVVGAIVELFDLTK